MGLIPNTELEIYGKTAFVTEKWLPKIPDKLRGAQLRKAGAYFKEKIPPPLDPNTGEPDEDAPERWRLGQLRAMPDGKFIVVWKELFVTKAVK